MHGRLERSSWYRGLAVLVVLVLALGGAAESLWRGSAHASSLLTSGSAPSGPVVVGKSRFSRTEANPDGTFTTTYSVRPMYWQDPKTGEWMDFDNRLASLTNDPDYAYRNSSNGYTVSFGKPAGLLAGGPLMRLESSGGSLSVSALGAGPSGASADGASVTYKDVYPGVDARYTVDDERVKEDLLIKSAPASAASLAFKFSLSLDGLSASKNAEGSIDFKDSSGKVVFEVPTPFMTDSSNGGGDYSQAVKLDLTDLGGGRVQLVLTPDLAWLSDPSRVYPVDLDPTFDTFSGTFQPDSTQGQDTFLYSADSGTSTTRGDAATIDVATDSSGQQSRNTLIQFPEVSKLPQDSGVISSTLQLYAYYGNGGMPVEMHRNTKPWDESTATWDTMPIGTTTTTYVWDKPSISINAWNSFDTSELARDWVSGRYDNYGVRLESAGSAGQWVRFYSSEYTGSPSLRPKLQITYVRASRYGVSRLWNYTSHSYGGGNTGYVNTSNGNLVLTHLDGSIPARGFAVALVHTYNSQDPNYTTSPYKGADFGQGWSFSQSVRLYPVDCDSSNNCGAVVLKDGTGGANRTYVADKNTNGTLSYTRPLYYDWTLTKDTSSTADPKKVWTLKADRGGARLYFDAGGKLRRREDRHCNDPTKPSDCNYLDYSYTTDGTDLADPSGKLSKVTDVAGRTTSLEYNSSGLLSKITDMAGRVSTFEYDSDGNLTAIHNGVDPATGAAAATTTFGYDDANQLESITNPNGHTSYIGYKVEESWETAGSTDGWGSDNSYASVQQSAIQAHYGAGSLEVDTAGASASTKASVSKTYSPALSMNAVPQELVLWAWVDDSSAQIDAQVVIQHNYNQTTYGPVTPLKNLAWAAVRMPNTQVDPAWQVDKLTVLLYPASGSFNGRVYLDHLFAKGIAESLSDASGPGNVVASFGYDFDQRDTTVSRPDPAGNPVRVVFHHDPSGQVSGVTDPAGNQSSATYDNFLRLTNTRLPGEANGTSYTYYSDSASQQTNFLKNVTDELSEKATDGVETDTTSANYGDTVYGVDPLNNLKDGSSSTSTTFDASVYNVASNGNLTSVDYKQYAKGADLSNDGVRGCTQATASTTCGALLRQTKLTYGDGGLVTSMSPPKCVAAGSPASCKTNYSYDTPKGYLTQVDAPAGKGETARRKTNLTHNPDGSVDTITYPTGRKTRFTYDPLLGRLTDITYYNPDGSTAYTVHYDLDADGNITRMTDGSGSTSRTYDVNDRVTRIVRTQGGKTEEADYSYYPDGLLGSETTLHDPSSGAGQTVSYTYDGSLRLASESDPNDNNRRISFKYDARSRLLELDFGSTANEQAAYDPAGRVSSLKVYNSNSNPSLQQSFEHAPIWWTPGGYG